MPDVSNKQIVKMFSSYNLVNFKHACTILCTYTRLRIYKQFDRKFEMLMYKVTCYLKTFQNCDRTKYRRLIFSK